MPSLGITDESLSTIQTEVATILDFSDENLSTSLFQLGLQIGERFAKKNNKDVELYQAEAIFIITLVCKDESERFLGTSEETRQPIVNEDLLKRRVYRELYQYMYADRVVSASRTTVWRHEQENKQVVTTTSLTADHPKSQSLDGGVTRESIDVIDKRCSEIELLELFEEVARSAHEKEYLRMKINGADESEIAEHMGVCSRIVNDIRARLTKRIRKAQRQTNVISEES